MILSEHDEHYEHLHKHTASERAAMFGESLSSRIGRTPTRRIILATSARSQRFGHVVCILSAYSLRRIDVGLVQMQTLLYIRFYVELTGQHRATHPSR